MSAIWKFLFDWDCEELWAAMFPSQGGTLRRASSMQRVRQMVSPFGSMREQAKSRIDGAAAELNALSHGIWSHPETAFNEHHAHNLLTTFLENDGFEQVEKNFILPTGFRASYGFDGGRTIAVLAEYDAHGEHGHANGHNLTAECAVGVALGVKAALESMEPKVQKGRIVILGCPAESSAGKQHFINAGVFFGVSAALMVSPFSRSVLKPRQEALEKVRYKFYGKSAHAGLAPWEGHNALDAAVQCYNSISAMRQHFDPEVRVYGVFVKGGSHLNMVPDETELLFYIRAPTTVQLQPAVKKCEDCATGAAASAQCSINIEYGSFYAELKTNEHLTALYKKHCSDLGLKFPKQENNNIVGLSSDMGNVSFVTPTIHSFFEINTNAATHTREFANAAGAPEAQKATLLQAKALALTAIDLLQPGGSKVVDGINREFQKISAPSEIVGNIPIGTSGPDSPLSVPTPPSDTVTNGPTSPAIEVQEDTKITDDPVQDIGSTEQTTTADNSKAAEGGNTGDEGVTKATDEKTPQENGEIEAPEAQQSATN
ncbi:Peptidase M20 domain-containing protein 2 [Holothuria leucospilota]|uniref:Peptidase M20 domain-containing protein 2 n=1 Tax=Holothuria leucospilota TaxID=206669 RepID=A0A9Q1C433_HOLLE|nr:Peptidase M20 domain-containing protein 2 [Holothuria leucospilota]